MQSKSDMPKAHEATALLKADHKTVKDLFKRFEKLCKQEGGDAEKMDIKQTVLQELAIHASIEEQIFYPAVKKCIPEETDMLLESLEEHGLVKRLCSELDKMTPADERFEAKMTVLSEVVLHHADEEESELFPKVKEQLSHKQLLEIGAALAEAKGLVSIKATPAAPDTPPRNLTVETQPLFDKVMDVISPRK